MYNEEGYTLQRSLNSMQILDPRPTMPIDLMIACDGIGPMAPSTKIFLRHLFGTEIPLEESKWHALASSEFQTFVINRIDKRLFRF